MFISQCSQSKHQSEERKEGIIEKVFRRVEIELKNVALLSPDSGFFSYVYARFLEEHSEVLRAWKIHPEYLNIQNFVSRFFRYRYLQDFSSNPSSNVSGKTIARFRIELINSFLRYLTFETLYGKMVELYGEEEAIRLSELLLDGSLYLHDSSSYICGYCLGVDFVRIITDGMPYGQLYSLPPKKPRTFINQVKEAVIELSNEFAGAIAFPTLILLYTYMYLKYYGKDCKVDEREVKDDFQNLVHTVNKELRNGVESPFTNLSFFDRYIVKELLDNVYPSLVEEVGGKEIFMERFWEIQRIVMEYLCKGDPVTGAPYRFPVLTANFVKDPETGKISDERFLELVCQNNTRGQMNIYVAESARKYSMCCRYQPDLENLKFDSFGNGGVNVGSIKVVTINLNRISLEVLENSGWEMRGNGDDHKIKVEFLERLKNRMYDARRILDAFRECLREHIEKGFFRYFSMKWFDLDKNFFSTIGFIGFYEAMNTLGEALDSKFAETVLERMDEVIRKFNSEGLPYRYNLEQIPGESAAALLPKLDRYFYGEKRVPYVLYANQFIPLYVNHSLIDKVEIEGRFFRYLSGGGITHINVLHELRPEEVRFVIELCVENGIEHFALNPVYSICEKGHYVLGKVKVCSRCGGRVVDYLTRVVGFFVPVSTWIKERREYEFERREFFDADELSFENRM